MMFVLELLSIQFGSLIAIDGESLKNNMTAPCHNLTAQWSSCRKKSANAFCNDSSCSNHKKTALILNQHALSVRSPCLHRLCVDRLEVWGMCMIQHCKGIGLEV